MVRQLHTSGIASAMLLASLARPIEDALESTEPTEHGAHAMIGPSPDDGGDDEPVAALLAENQLTQIAPPESMPIGNRFLHAEPQNYPQRFTPIDDWTLGVPMVLRSSMMS